MALRRVTPGEAVAETRYGVKGCEFTRRAAQIGRGFRVDLLHREAEVFVVWSSFGGLGGLGGLGGQSKISLVGYAVSTAGR